MFPHRLAAAVTLLVSTTLLVHGAFVVAQPAAVQFPPSIAQGSDGMWVLKDGATSEDVEQVRKVFIQFVGFMFQNQLMPSNSEPWGYNRGSTLGRKAIDTFLAATTTLLPNNSRCLEWDVRYTASIQACTEKWDFRYSKNHHGSANMAAKQILADLDHPGPKLLEQFADFFDAVFATQVFEHVSKPWLSAKHIFQLLKPGGRVFFTVPFLSRYHDSPEDHYRYTIYGAMKIFKDAGFVVNQSYIGGSSMLTVAYLLGYGTSDLSEEQLKDVLIPHNTWRANRSKPAGNGRNTDDDLMFASFILFEKPA